jgi:hypothetical protein
MSDRLRAKPGEGEFANPRLTPWAIFSRPSRGCASTTEIAKRRMAHALWACDLGGWASVAPQARRPEKVCASLRVIVGFGPFVR